jgi:hypothetical protein
MENPKGRVIPYFQIRKAREENSCGMGRKFVQIRGILLRYRKVLVEIYRMNEIYR